MPSTAATKVQPAPGIGQPVRTVAVAAVAKSVPVRVVPNAEVADRIGVTEEWIVTRTGVRERHIVSEGETVVSLAVDAGRKVLERAGVEPAELDLVLVGTSAADDLTPNAAPGRRRPPRRRQRGGDGHRRRLQRLHVGDGARHRADRGRPRREGPGYRL